MAEPTQSLTELAAKISEYATHIDGYLAKNNLPAPSFNKDSPNGLPHAPEVQMAKLQMETAILDLQGLIQAPAENLCISVVPQMQDLAVLNVLNQFDFWSAVPLDGCITYADLAKKVNLSEELVRRLLRVSMVRHCFVEKPAGSGNVEHTSLSAAVERKPKLKSWLGHNLEEIAPGSMKLAETLKIHGESAEPSKTAGVYTLIPDMKDGSTVWDWFAQDGEGERKGWRARRFGEAMEVVMADETFRFDLHIHRMLDWNSLGEGPLIDIGGSHGHISKHLALSYPNLHCTVQDLPDLQSGFNATLDPSLASRVNFQAHNFFEPEPVKGAAAYFLKHILHDWSDLYCRKILSQVVPAMTPGKSRLLIMEAIVPPDGVAPAPIMRMMGGLDIQMLTALNGKERTGEDWIALLKSVDSRLVVKGIHQPPGSAFGLVEAVLEG